MKAMKLVETIKKPGRRPAISIAVGVLAYIGFVYCPALFRELFDLWRDLGAFGVEGNSVWTCLFSLCITVLVLLGLLAGVAIWIISICISWAAFRKSRKKAYLFILAYFLMPLATEPIVWLSRQVANRYNTHRGQYVERELEITQARPVVPLPYVTPKNISLPVGPFLLLAGVWYLYRKETTKDGEPPKPKRTTEN